MEYMNEFEVELFWKQRPVKVYYEQNGTEDGVPLLEITDIEVEINGEDYNANFFLNDEKIRDEIYTTLHEQHDDVVASGLY